MTAAPPLSATDAFASIIEVLCRHVAAQSVPWGRIVPRLVLLICTRVRRTGHRFAVLADRVRARTLRVSAPRSRSAASRRVRPRPALPEATAETESNAAQPPPERLPKDFAWLVRLAGSEAVCYGGQLAYLLRNPEMVALLTASPQIVRLLRPLCRALGVDPGLLPPRPCKAESPRCSPAPTAAPTGTEATPRPASTPGTSFSRGREPVRDPEPIVLVPRSPNFATA